MASRGDRRRRQRLRVGRWLVRAAIRSAARTARLGVRRALRRGFDVRSAMRTSANRPLRRRRRWIRALRRDGSLRPRDSAVAPCSGRRRAACAASGTISATRPISAPLPTRCSTMWPMPIGCLDAALLQRVVARLVEAGLGEIAKAEQRTRGIAGADQHAVARKGRDRRVDALDQPLQPFDQRHGAAGGVAGGDQNAVAAIGKIEPRAAAGREPAGRGAKAAQPLQPDRAVRRQPAREPRDLPPVRIGRTESLSARALRRWPRRTRVRRPDWPTGSACRRSTTAMRAGRSSHAPPAADRRAPATGIPHYSSRRHDRMVGLLLDDGLGNRRPNDDSLNGSLVSQARSGRSTARRAAAVSKAAITLIRLNHWAGPR